MQPLKDKQAADEGRKQSWKEIRSLEEHISIGDRKKECELLKLRVSKDLEWENEDYNSIC